MADQLGYPTDGPFSFVPTPGDLAPQLSAPQPWQTASSPPPAAATNTRLQPPSGASLNPNPAPAQYPNPGLYHNGPQGVATVRSGSQSSVAISDMSLQQQMGWQAPELATAPSQTHPGATAAPQPLQSTAAEAESAPADVSGAQHTRSIGEAEGDPMAVVAVDRRQLDLLKSTVEGLMHRNARIEDTVSKLSYNEKLVRQQVLDQQYPKVLKEMERTDLERLVAREATVDEVQRQPGSPPRTADLSTKREGKDDTEEPVQGTINPMIMASVEHYDKDRAVLDLNDDVEGLLKRLKDFDKSTRAWHMSSIATEGGENAALQPSQLPL